MSLKIRPLTPELAAKAEKELNEVPSRLAEDVQALKDWIAKQPHLRARTDDQFLVNFLRGSKHSLERAKEKLDLCYTMRTSMPEMFTTEDPLSPRNMELISMGNMLPLPKTATPDGPRIIMMRFSADPSTYTMEEMMRVQSFIQAIMMYEDDHMMVAGQVGFIDLKGASVGHFTQFTPSLMKKFAVMTQDGSPVRMKGFNYINVPSFFESVFGFFKSFLNEKMKKRVSDEIVFYKEIRFYLYLLQLIIHSDVESLYKEIPKEMLPVEYGGNNGTIDDLVKYWQNKIVEYRDYLLEEAQFGTDESKRQKPLKQHDALFGVEGSFRKLDVD